jgi:molecular chaperone Hsp33
MRVFRLHAVEYHCPYDEDKVKAMLRSLGREEVDSILAEQGEVLIRNEMCGHEYRFDAGAIAKIFAH